MIKDNIFRNLKETGFGIKKVSTETKTSSASALGNDRAENGA